MVIILYYIVGDYYELRIIFFIAENIYSMIIDYKYSSINYDFHKKGGTIYDNY